MRRLLLTVCAILVAAIPMLASAIAQTGDQSPTGAPSGPSPIAPPSVTPPPVAPTPAGPPAARLIKPRQNKIELRAWEKQRPRPGPIDEQCKPLKQQLEGELARPANAHKAFQARLARNAGTRLCRDGQVEKGMAEFRKGLSYLEETHQP